jgi:hypothetical protein
MHKLWIYDYKLHRAIGCLYPLCVIAAKWQNILDIQEPFTPPLGPFWLNPYSLQGGPACRESFLTFFMGLSPVLCFSASYKCSHTMLILCVCLNFFHLTLWDPVLVISAAITSSMDWVSSTTDIYFSQIWRLELWHQVLAVLASPEASHLGLQLVPYSHSCPSVCICDLVSFLIKTQTFSSDTLFASFYL